MTDPRAKMQHSQSDVALGTGGSWADIKVAEGLKKRSNTAQNLQFYGAFGQLGVMCE